MSWDGAGLSTWGRGLAWMAGVEILPARSVGKGGPAAGWWRGRGETCGFPLHHSLRERSRSEEHTSELQSLMRISYAVFCLTKKLVYVLLSNPAALYQILSTPQT